MLDLSLRPTTTKPTSGRIDHLWVMVAVCSILAGLPAVLAGMLATRQTPIYAARAELQYRIDGPVSSDNLRTDRRLATQLVAITSRALLEPVASRNGLGYEKFRDATSASIVNNSEVIRIEVHDKSRSVALAAVSQLAEAYITRARFEFETRRTSLENQVAAIVAAQETITTRVLALGKAAEASVAAAPPGSQTVVNPELALLQERDRSLADQRLALKSQLDDLSYRIQAGAPAGLLGSPYSVSEKISPQPLLAEVAGGLIGLTLAATTASLYIWWRRRVA
jgi:hypothetical protein